MRVRLLQMLTLLLMMATSATAAPVFYVAVDGNDTWSGNAPEANADKTDGPFATLGHARDVLRAAGLAEGGAVYVRGGTYYLSAPLTFEATDSGTPEHPVVWQAYKGEAVDLVGGVRVEGFVPFKDNIQKKEGLDLPAPVQQLFLDGARQTLARWPNLGEGELPGGGWAFVQSQVEAEKSRSFHFDGDTAAKWAGLNGLEISIWPNYNWWQTIAPVKAIDAATKTISLASDISYTIEPGRRYFLQNALEMLDAPGEWYFDAAAKTLYFWPPAPLDAKSTVWAPIAETVIQASGLHDVTLIGLSAEVARGDAVVLQDCSNVLFAKAIVRNTYGFGVVVKGGQSVRVHGNDIYATGKGGVVLSGGDRKTLTPGNHEAVNNHIHDYAQIFNTYNCGVNIEGVGNRIRHNLIHDAPHIGILLTGNDHLIEYNDIHHVCTQGADNGGFYMGRDWTQRGNIFRYNKVHDIYGFGLLNEEHNKDGQYRYESPHQAWGVYLDDCSSGVQVLGNLFYRVPLCGVMIGGGRDNVVKENIFSECTPAVHIDDRWDAYPWALMDERLKAMNYTQPPYSERYPELLTMGDDPRTPANNRVERNVITWSHDSFRGLSTTAPSSGKAVVYDLSGFDATTCVFNENVIDVGGLPVRVAFRAYKQKDGAGDLEWEQWREKGFDKDSLLAPLGFVDAANDDYMLRRPVNEVLRLKLRPLPTDQMGLYQDELRASWPVEKDTRKDGVDHKEWSVTVAP